MGMNTIEELKERVILIGVSTSDGDDTEESLKELKELADTAGAETVGTVIQNREAVHPGTYIGKGKIEEVRAMAFGLNATGVICDDELSPDLGVTALVNAADGNAILSQDFLQLVQNDRLETVNA